MNAKKPLPHPFPHQLKPGVLIGSLPFLLIACQTEINGKVVTKNDRTDEYPQSSIFVEEQINSKLAEVPYLRGKQVVDACMAIAQIGPAAIPKLQAAARDENPMRRVFVMNVLGAIGDRRAFPILEKALSDDDVSVRYEAARSFVKMGDWDRGVPILIDGLGSTSVFVRTLCHDSLRKATRLDFGFQPRGADAGRAAAIEKWSDWFKKHRDDLASMR